MNVYITGHTRGLGLELYNFFQNQGYNVTGFSHTNGFDIERDFEKILQEIIPGSIFVNNAYASGSQIKFVERLDKIVSKMVVSGSIASEYPDPNLVKYSVDKKLLKETIYKLGLNNSQTKYLHMSLTSSSYQDPQLVLNTLEFWLANPDVIEIGYTVNE